MTPWLRSARPTDAGRTGEILWERARVEPGSFDLFSEAEAIACCGRMIDGGWVRVAVVNDRIEAFLARNGAEVEALYVAGPAVGQGLGEALMREAMQDCDGLRLWVHPANAGARRFYRRLGFVEAERQAGTGGIEMLWQRETVT